MLSWKTSDCFVGSVIALTLRLCQRPPMIRKQISQNDQFILSECFSHFLLLPNLPFRFMTEYGERGRKEAMLVEVQQLHTHKHAQTHRTECPLSAEVRAPTFHTLALFFTFSPANIRSSSRLLQRSNIIRSKLGSCFKMPPHSPSLPEALCPYFFGPGGQCMTA